MFHAIIFSYKSLWDNDTLINTANIDFLMSNIDNTSTINSSPKAGKNRLDMQVYLLKANSFKEPLNKIFNMLPNKNIRNDHNTRKVFPFLRWNF